MFESNHTFGFQEEANLVQDREDLIGLLKMRFETIPAGVTEAIYQLDSLDALERLILVAANASNFTIFIEEMEASEGSFRITGERFNPIDTLSESGGGNGQKGK